jgi:hypothetical protein
VAMWTSRLKARFYPCHPSEPVPDVSSPSQPITTARHSRGSQRPGRTASPSGGEITIRAYQLLTETPHMVANWRQAIDVACTANRRPPAYGLDGQPSKPPSLHRWKCWGCFVVRADHHTHGCSLSSIGR